MLINHQLTRSGRVMHIYSTKLTIIGSDNGLSPGWRQAIIWTNAGILLIGALATNISEILSKIYTFSLKKMHLKILSGKRRPSYLSLNVLSLQPCTWGKFHNKCSSYLCVTVDNTTLPQCQIWLWFNRSILLLDCGYDYQLRNQESFIFQKQQQDR